MTYPVSCWYFFFFFWMVIRMAWLPQNVTIFLPYHLSCICIYLLSTCFSCQISKNISKTLPISLLAFTPFLVCSNLLSLSAITQTDWSLLLTAVCKPWAIPLKVWKGSLQQMADLLLSTFTGIAVSLTRHYSLCTSALHSLHVCIQYFSRTKIKTLICSFFFLLLERWQFLNHIPYCFDLLSPWRKSWRF